MIDFDTAFGHDLFKIPIQDTVADMEKHSLKDHALGEMVAFEINRYGRALAFKLKSPYQPRPCQSNQPQNFATELLSAGYAWMVPADRRFAGEVSQ